MKGERKWAMGAPGNILGISDAFMRLARQLQKRRRFEPADDTLRAKLTQKLLDAAAKELDEIRHDVEKIRMREH